MAETTVIIEDRLVLTLPNTRTRPMKPSRPDPKSAGKTSSLPSTPADLARASLEFVRLALYPAVVILGELLDMVGVKAVCPTHSGMLHSEFVVNVEATLR